MESCYSFISAWLIDAHEEATFTPHLLSLRARRIQSHSEDRASIWTGVSHGDARVHGTTGGRQAESATERQSLPLISFDPICKALSEGLKYIYIVLLKSQGEGWDSEEG